MSTDQQERGERTTPTTGGFGPGDGVLVANDLRKELGGLMQTSPLKLTKLSSVKALGSTMAELMLVKILNSSAQRMS